jgi:hypothetical protein
MTSSLQLITASQKALSNRLHFGIVSPQTKEVISNMKLQLPQKPSPRNMLLGLLLMESMILKLRMLFVRTCKVFSAKDNQDEKKK